MALIKKEFEEANLTHARELAEVREGWKRAKETHARELEEANRKHAQELSKLREGLEKANETHKREINEALQAQSMVVSHSITPYLD